MLNYVTPQEAHQYREWLRKNENDDFIYWSNWSKLQELDNLRNQYCTDVVPMSPETRKSLEVKATNIWQII